MPVVGDSFLGLSPDVSHGIEFGCIGRKEVEFDGVLLPLQLFKNPRCLVVPDIVGHEMDLYWFSGNWTDADFR